VSGRNPVPATRRGRYILALLVVAALGGAIALVSHRRPQGHAPSGAPTFVGGKTCAPCHTEETHLWAGSHHDHAMGVASEQSVVGDFNGEVLRATHERHPGDRDLLVALATISRDSGIQQAAQQYAAALVAVAPWDSEARRLQQEMSGP